MKQYNKSMKSYFSDCSTKGSSPNIYEGRDDEGSNTNTKPDERRGPLIECIDVVEIVFGVCRDLETYMTDEKRGGEDEVALFTISFLLLYLYHLTFHIPCSKLQYEIERKVDWIPYLSERFPYLTERVLTFPSDDFHSNAEEEGDEDENPYGIPDKLAVFVNFPKKKKSSEKLSAAFDSGNDTNENKEKHKEGKTTEFSCKSFGIF